MRKKILIVVLTLVSILVSIPLGNAATRTTPQYQYQQSLNRQVYLGYATINGTGGTSVLEAVAEHDLVIGIGSPSTYVDFYITYDIVCSGTTDEGVVTLSIALNGQNVSLNIAQSPTKKNGTLVIDNILVHRQDTLTFIIDAAYASIIPFHLNETRALGAGVFPKTLDHAPSRFPHPWIDRWTIDRFPLIQSVLEHLNRFRSQ
jgi:hypothetical protein